MTRAELWYIPPGGEVNGVIVLCPGYNSSGKSMVNNRKWRAFAKEKGLGLVGISFASEEKDLQSGKGYYYACNGSGEVLLQGIREIFGEEVSLYLYGFSGGGHFVSRFMMWKPEVVAGWCAYGAGWWDEPESGKLYPPGIVVSGSGDDRYNACFSFFRQGRELGQPWLWCKAAGFGHEMSPPLEAFTRDFFSALLLAQEECWIDIGSGELVNLDDVEEKSSTGFLPGADLLPGWKTLNEESTQ